MMGLSNSQQCQFNSKISFLHCIRSVLSYCLIESDNLAQSFAILWKLYLSKQRFNMFVFIYCFILITYWILSGIRFANTQ